MEMFRKIHVKYCGQSFCSVSTYSESRTMKVTQQHKGSACLNWISSLMSVRALMQIPSDTKQNEE